MTDVNNFHMCLILKICVCCICVCKSSITFISSLNKYKTVQLVRWSSIMSRIFCCVFTAWFLNVLNIINNLFASYWKIMFNQITIWLIMICKKSLIIILKNFCSTTWYNCLINCWNDSFFHARNFNSNSSF